MGRFVTSLNTSDGEFAGSLDGQPHAVAAGVDNHDLNVLSDGDRFHDFAAQNEHVQLPLKEHFGVPDRVVGTLMSCKARASDR